MSHVTITITTDNAAFEDSNYGPEVARILRRAAVHMEDTSFMEGDTFPLHHLNGNRVGELKIHG